MISMYYLRENQVKTHISGLTRTEFVTVTEFVRVFCHFIHYNQPLTPILRKNQLNHTSHKTNQINTLSVFCPHGPPFYRAYSLSTRTHARDH